MKRLFLMLVAVSLFGAARAQAPETIPGDTKLRRDVRRVEVELALGPTFGYAALPGLTNMRVGICEATEFRYNLRRVPLDVGVHFGCSFYWRDSPATCLSKIFFSPRMMGVADYNLRVARRVECFFGAGIGAVCIGPMADMPGGGASDWSIRLGAMPRVGFECWSHLRLTFGYVWTERANNHCLMTIGIVFGGARLRAGF